MAADGDLPELATNEEWRGIMARARKETRPDHPKGFTQAELGTKVGATQEIISMIEGGKVASSKFVRPICQVLGIPTPEHFTDEVDRAWVQLGRILRARGLDRAKAATQVVVALAGITDEELRTAGIAPANDEATPDSKNSK